MPPLKRYHTYIILYRYRFYFINIETSLTNFFNGNLKLYEKSKYYYVNLIEYISQELNFLKNRSIISRRCRRSL